jgi:hypothetical protein
MRNVEAFVAACIDAIVEQGDAGIELLVLDDGSTDASLDIAARRLARAPFRAELLRHAIAAGVARSRNTLMRHATGDYLWFVDSDDVVLAGAIDALRTAVATSAPDLVLFDHRVVRDAFGLKHRLRGESHRSTFRGMSGVVSSDRSRLVEGAFLQGQMHVWSKVARRALWLASPFPERAAFEDITASSRLLAQAGRWVHLDRPLVGYRQRAGSIMDTLPIERMHDLLDAVDDVGIDFDPATGPALDRRARFAVDYFRLRSLGAVARRVSEAAESSESLASRGRSAVQRAFPAGIGAVIAGCRRRGWWLRAWRHRRAFEAVGWT